MLRKMKIVFIFAVAFKMFSTYAMEQEQQSCFEEIPCKRVQHIADYLPQKDICNLALTSSYLNDCVSEKRIFCVSEKRIFNVSGSTKKICDFFKLMRQKKLSCGKIKLVLRKKNLDLLSQIPKAMLKKVIELDLSNIGLSALPKAIKSLSNLRKLNLSYNRLSKENALKNLSSLTNLEMLDLSCNPLLSALPEAIKSLSNLRKLDLKCIGLSEKESLENLSSLLKLVELDLSYNSLRFLPEAIKSLPNLRKLDLSYNRLFEKAFEKALENLSSLTNLEMLDLKYCILSIEKVNTLQNALPNTRILS